MVQWWTMGENLSERLTVPMTPKMRRQVDELADDLGVRAVDVGRLAVVFFVKNYNLLDVPLCEAREREEKKANDDKVLL